jgi:hypothetical protein
MMTRNNIFVSMTGDYIIEDTGSTGIEDNWRTDLDYDGVAWGESDMPKFKWHGTRYNDLAEFQVGSGQEANGIHLPMDCFETLDVPGPPPAVIPPQHITLTESCAGVDHGELLPNINDDYIGQGPDLGAHERGAPLQHYGPRDPDDLPFCGDGNVDSDETCDPPSSCPTDCDDDDACTADQLTGSADDCNAECRYSSVTECIDDDGCCPQGCTGSLDSDCEEADPDGDGDGCGCSTNRSPAERSILLILLVLFIGRRSFQGRNS